MNQVLNLEAEEPRRGFGTVVCRGVEKKMEMNGGMNEVRALIRWVN